MKFYLLLIVFFLFLGLANGALYCAEDISASKIERSQEILEKEKALRDRKDTCPLVAVMPRKALGWGHQKY